ncbi:MULTISPECIES: diguanylate cyclase [unclassified Fusibacter]|uniref:diguanylate cyclase n=1 Tax=unclassified Fusibacter TaxID=2624464 RepID=UPI001011A198|nr:MULTISPECIES: diguanylate cyclase [unclassified Fusibacter]MCK8058490.1 diguanylate cyclase [Fusibacter sp. A2]NPE22741.1 diguanylate cyclase [Fusibacter sp. A1]RXV60300.1 diguanylate cyclase [Fusibacter sp. A1]
MIVTFGAFYVVFVRSTFVNALTLLCLVDFLFVFFFLKKQMFKTGKSLLLSTMSVLSTISSITIVYYLYARSLSKTLDELKVLADTDTLTSIANLLNDKISNHNFITSDYQTINFTVSIGVVSYSEEYTNFSNMLKVADEALYEAKTNGRNQVVVK